MKSRLMLLAWLVGSLVGSSTLYASEVQPVGTERFISLSDIHFNPFLSCKKEDKPCALIANLEAADPINWEAIFKQEHDLTVSAIHQDTNYVLLASSLATVKAIAAKEHPQFVLVLGDWLGHNYLTLYNQYAKDPSHKGYELFVKKTYQFLMNQIKASIPNTEIYSVVGNNDSFANDYGITPNGKFFKEIGSIWAQGLINNINKETFNQDFHTGGYYTVLLPNSNNRIIVLDTTLFSSLVVGKKIKHAAEKQLDWLNDQLALAETNHQSVMLAFHIPLGIDVFKTLKTKPLSFIQTFWKDNYALKFQEILAAHPGVVKEILPGHIHSDAFQLITLNKVVDIPVTLTPAISPIYGNNPSFKVFEYDPATFQLTDFDVYFLPLAANNNQWYHEYNFDQIFQPACQHCTLLPGLKNILGSNYVDAYLTKYLHVGNDMTLSKEQAKYYHCGMTQFNYDSYKTCCDADNSFWEKVPGSMYVEHLWQNVVNTSNDIRNKCSVL